MIKNMVEFFQSLEKFCFGTCTVNQHDDVVQYNWEQKHKSPFAAGHKNERIFYH